MALQERTSAGPRALDVPPNLLKLYIAHSPLALVRCDSAGRFTEWSPRAESMFGWTENEVLGKTFDEVGFVYEDDRAQVRAILSQLSAETTTWNTSQNRNRRKDGSVIWCRWFNAYLPYESASGFVCLAEDVTDAVAAREAASLSEGRLRALFETTPDSLSFFRLDGRLTDTNPGSERMMGVDRSLLLGRDYTEFAAEESVAQARSLFARVLGGETVNATLSLLRPNGSTFSANIVAGPLRNGSEISGAYCCARDITEANDARERLEASEARFRSIFDNNPDPMIALDADATVTRTNAAAARMLALGADALDGKTLGDIVAPADMAIALASFNRAIAGLAGGVEFRVAATGGEPIPAFVTLIPIRFGGAAAGVHLHVRDLRAELAHERELAAHAERIRDLYLSAAAANENAERQINATIEAGCRILGMSSGAVYDAQVDAIVEHNDASAPAVEVARLPLAADGMVAFDDAADEPALEAIDPTLRPGALIGASIEVGGAPYGTLVFADPKRRPDRYTAVDRDFVQLMGALIGSAIERGRSRARLQSLAYTDGVTALPNRTWLIEHLRAQLDEAGKAGRTVGVLFLDLDRFKDINDTLGHESGDELLRIIGERLTRAIRTDDVVARMGGDEFVVLALGATDIQALAGLAERIIATVEEPLTMGDSEHFVTTSIGIATFPADGRDAETLVKHADVAMYRAKERGRNTYQFFTPALNATLQTRLSQEKTLRKALENNEFSVYYQPQHDLVSRELVAVEALVRWNHPRSGLVLPGQFIPNAELSGLIVALGDFVLERACNDISMLRRGPAPNLRLGVNLSARQFHQQRLAAKIRACVERTGLDPTALELEITESVAMNDAAVTVTIMRELGAEGVRLAVDDFGTGYSSLGYLRRFPLDSIKIDRSFVTDLAHEPDDATIVRTVIAMAHALDLEVIAEGVETSEQLAFLEEERCDRVQGFYYSQAIPLDALEAYIASAARPATAAT